MNNKTYRDQHGKSLSDYERPSVAVDTAVFSLSAAGNELMVLQVRRAAGTGWALPGTFLHPGETLADAVNRSLRDKANVQGLRPRQLHVFDAPDRDERGWVLSVAHIQVAQPHLLQAREPAGTRLMPARAPGRLPYDHQEIVRRALTDLQARYADRPDPDGLLGEEFTLRALQSAHEAVAGNELDRDAFRRAVKDHLVETGHMSAEGRGRPAQKFRRGKAPLRSNRRRIQQVSLFDTE